MAFRLPHEGDVDRTSIKDADARSGLGGDVEADPGLVGQAGDPFGPQHRRELRSMLGRRRADTTGTPSVTTLPQGTLAPWTATTGTTTTPGSGRTWAAWSAPNDTARIRA
jgi:hypothetical protein